MRAESISPINDMTHPVADPVPYVSAVMPCLNEEDSLAVCIEKAKGCFARLGIVGEVIVADNGSTDRSVAIAESCGARVVHVSDKGYGAALTGGVLAARGKIVIMADSDDSYDWSSLDGFIAGIEAGYDMVVGNRFRGGIEPGAMPTLHRYLGNPVLSFVSRIAFRIPIGDFHCGMRAFTPEAFRRLGLSSTGMEFATEMIASAANQRLRVCEIPIRLYPDKRNRPPHLRSFRDGWRHLRYILSHSPDHLYLWPGSMMMLLGLLLTCVLIAGPVKLGGHYFGIHFMVLGATLTLLGANVLSMGLLAKLVLSMAYPAGQGLLPRLLGHRYLLELVLTVGGIFALTGLVADLFILKRWLSSGSASMEDTVHPAIAASTFIVLGVELAFSAFLIFLVRARMPLAKDRDARA
jgi:glycosyltransferase involved in cell wall biosynthesis